jgi:hypothetical protein
MDEMHCHRYRVVGDKYVGNGQFKKVKTTIAAYSSQEANNIAWGRYIVPSKIKDLGTTTLESMRV